MSNPKVITAPGQYRRRNGEVVTVTTTGARSYEWYVLEDCVAYHDDGRFNAHEEANALDIIERVDSV